MTAPTSRSRPPTNGDEPTARRSRDFRDHAPRLRTMLNTELMRLELDRLSSEAIAQIYDALQHYRVCRYSSTAEDAYHAPTGDLA